MQLLTTVILGNIIVVLYVYAPPPLVPARDNPKSAASSALETVSVVVPDTPSLVQITLSSPLYLVAVKTSVCPSLPKLTLLDS